MSQTRPDEPLLLIPPTAGLLLTTLTFLWADARQTILPMVVVVVAVVATAQESELVSEIVALHSVERQRLTPSNQHAHPTSPSTSYAPQQLLLPPSNQPHSSTSHRQTLFNSPTPFPTAACNPRPSRHLRPRQHTTGPATAPAVLNTPPSTLRRAVSRAG